tara:strand:+ start:381 stop:494 length:114 start_codon:yes stop_codon:yes gene_type:complete
LLGWGVEVEKTDKETTMDSRNQAKKENKDFVETNKEN